MSRKCKTCDGRGRWQTREEHGEEVILVWHECNDCHGTGEKPTVIDPFDIDDGGEDED